MHSISTLDREEHQLSPGSQVPGSSRLNAKCSQLLEEQMSESVRQGKDAMVLNRGWSHQVPFQEQAGQNHVIRLRPQATSCKLNMADL